MTSSSKPPRWTSRQRPGRSRVPWLIIHGDQDESVPFREADQLKASSSRPDDPAAHGRRGEAIPSAPPIPGASCTPQLDTVFDATLGWLAAHLK